MRFSQEVKKGEIDVKRVGEVDLRTKLKAPFANHHYYGTLGSLEGHG